MNPGLLWSLGTGKDIFFDHALIEKYGVTVRAFDPTLNVKTCLALQTPFDNSVFVMLASRTVTMRRSSAFFHNRTSLRISLILSREYSKESIQVPMIRLGTSVCGLEHSRIDRYAMNCEDSRVSATQIEL